MCQPLPSAHDYVGEVVAESARVAAAADALSKIETSAREAVDKYFDSIDTTIISTPDLKQSITLMMKAVAVAIVNAPDLYYVTAIAHRIDATAEMMAESVIMGTKADDTSDGPAEGVTPREPEGNTTADPQPAHDPDFDEVPERDAFNGGDPAEPKRD